MKQIKPLFKYIGGKSWLRQDLREQIYYILDNNKNINCYIEPFVGGLGAFLNIYDILIEKNIKNVILSDINNEIISTYNLIKNNPKELINDLLILEQEFANLIPKNVTKEEIKKDKKHLKNAQLYFNKIKKEFNENKKNNILNKKQCAMLVFLQKHSFNGIYRENSKGEYNTPFNWNYNNMLLTIKERINEIKEVFDNFEISFICQSFENHKYNKNTLYYLDPPYINENSNENKYSKNIFSIKEQISLIDNIKNSNFIYSNYKNELLLKSFYQINKEIIVKEIKRKNNISSKKESRQDNKIEILVVNRL